MGTEYGCLRTWSTPRLRQLFSEICVGLCTTGEPLKGIGKEVRAVPMGDVSEGSVAHSKYALCIASILQYSDSSLPYVVVTSTR